MSLSWVSWCRLTRTFSFKAQDPGLAFRVNIIKIQIFFVMDSSITKNKGNALKMNKNIFIKMIFNAFYTFLSKNYFAERHLERRIFVYFKKQLIEGTYEKLERSSFLNVVIMKIFLIITFLQHSQNTFLFVKTNVLVLKLT